MKITIDTKEDSHEEIRKIIRMLSSLVGEEVMTNSEVANQSDIFSSSNAQTESSDMFSMFSANSVNEAPTSNSEKKPEEVKQTKQEDIDFDLPDLEPYD